MSAFTLYGAPISMYTGKARAYLNYKGIDYQEILSTAKVYKKTIIPNTGVSYIPVLKTPSNDYVQDTTIIIDHLEKQFNARSVFPDTPKQLLVAKLFEWYADEWLVLPAMHYRWNKKQDKYIHGEFGKTVFPHLPGFIQQFIGKKVAKKFNGFVPKLGITEKTIPALEHWYEKELLPQLNNHFSTHNYLLGDRASVGDFGLIGPLYAHLYLDPAPRKIMKACAPHVITWIERMNATKPEIGDWLANDEIPETLLPVLTNMFTDFLPHMLQTPAAVAQWKQSNSDSKIPRAIAKSSFTLGASEDQRLVTPFSQWKLQRVLEAIPPAPASQESIKELLATIDGEQLLEVTIKAPVMRQNNKLVWQT